MHMQALPSRWAEIVNCTRRPTWPSGFQSEFAAGKVVSLQRSHGWQHGPRYRSMACSRFTFAAAEKERRKADGSFAGSRPGGGWCVCVMGGGGGGKLCSDKTVSRSCNDRYLPRGNNADF